MREKKQMDPGAERERTGKEKKAGREKRSCKDEALFWLEYGDRTEKEMVDRLTKKEYSQREIAECMAFLVDCSFIDDKRYALKFVEASMEKGRGPLRIRQELREKGIASAVAEKALEELYDRVTEREIALELAEKTAQKLRGGDSGFGFDAESEADEDVEYDDWGNPVKEALSEKDQAKIARKLAAAGFSSSVTYEAIRKLR